MELPLTHEEAVQEWRRFEEYLIKTRYALRDPATGHPVETGFAQVLGRVSRQFSCPGVAKGLRQGLFITATPFLMNGGNPHTTRPGFYSCYPLGAIADSTDAIFAMERDMVTIFQHSGGWGSTSPGSVPRESRWTTARAPRPGRSPLPRGFLSWRTGSARAASGAGP